MNAHGPNSILVEHNSEIDIQSRTVKREASRKVIDRVLQSYSPAPPVLEVGSGTGELYRMLPSGYQGKYMGIDNNPIYIAFNKAENPAVSLLEGDICRLPFPDDSHGVVLGLNVLDAVHSTNSALREIYRVLEPGGHFIHFHDRRPNLGFLARNVADNTVAFPRLNRFGAFDRFRLVPQVALEGLLPEQRRNVVGYAHLARDNYDAIENSIGFLPGTLTILTRRVEEYFGTASTRSAAVTAPFKKLFTEIVTRMLEHEGLQVVMSKDMPSETIVPTGVIERLLSHTYLRPPYSEGNTFTIDANAYYHFGRPKNHELPKGHTLVKTFLNTIVAIKPLNKRTGQET